MTTDPIAAARAMISDAIDFACAANQHLAGQEPEQAQQWRDALATLTEALGALADALDSERSRAEKADEYQKWLGEILAIIHRDGGHYQSEHGAEKAVADAQVALNNKLIEARLEGWRAGRDAAADEAQSCTHDPYVVRAIRALPEPEGE